MLDVVKVLREFSHENVQIIRNTGFTLFFFTKHSKICYMTLHKNFHDLTITYKYRIIKPKRRATTAKTFL